MKVEQDNDLEEKKLIDKEDEEEKQKIKSNKRI